MTAALVTPPAIEPVALSEAKAFLRLDATEDDDLIGALITAARVHVEIATRRVLISQTWRIYLDDWPDDGRVELPVAPVRSVDAVITYDADGHPATLAATAYQLDLASPRARLALKSRSGAAAPGQILNGVEIDVTAGYGTTGVSVPQPLRQAMMLLVARWYENREGTAIGVVPATIAQGYEALIAPFRLMRLS